MSRLVEQIAELTAFRDRDALDFSLATALKDLLRPQAVIVHRLVGEPGDQHWITRARVVAGDDGGASADPLWVDLDRLPALQALPHHARCLEQAAVVRPPGPPATTLFPLANDREVVGVLEVRTDHAPTDDELRLVAAILRICRNFHGLLDYSERDTLTGLLNRKTFDVHFQRAAQPTPAIDELPAPGVEQRRVAVARTACLGVIDVDHFKRVNDGFGHLIGDEVLLLLSRLMRGTFRHHDHLFRFGGEEFVVLVRCGSAAEARGAFERLRSTVERHVFPQVGQITISIGVSELRPGDNPTACFERADKAVYFAKQNGRNQVHDHEQLVAEGRLADASRASDVELF